jgi:hypothetical protein
MTHDEAVEIVQSMVGRLTDLSDQEIESIGTILELAWQYNDMAES